MPSSMSDVGGGIIPASRFLRRRAAAEDLGADVVDAFWSAAPRLYDFSQSQQLPLQAAPRPPSPPPATRRSPSPPPAAPCSPSPTMEQEAHDLCLDLLRSPSPSPSPPPAKRRSPSPSPPPPHEPRSPCPLTPLPPSPPGSPSPSLAQDRCGGCFLALLRGCVRWGARRSVTYGRNRAARSRPQDLVVVVQRPAVVDLGHEESKASGSKKIKLLEEVEKENDRAGVKTEKNRRVTRSSLRRRRAASTSTSGRARKKIPHDEVSCQNDKHRVVKKDKTGNRKRERSGRDNRRRDATKRAKKVLPVKKEDEESEQGSSGDKKRNRPEAAAEASSRVKREVVSTEEEEEVRVYHRCRQDAAKLPDKIPKEEEESKPATSSPRAKLAPKPSSPRGKKVDRWSAQRYAAGEAALLDILRARAASAGKPTLRVELRAEARKHIGDTGLLDHLLLHTAGKVPAGSAERIRRRYNFDGALEYFLEPAGLKALRREAGVDDPFWVPPPGWKLGDPVSPDAVARAVKQRVEELGAELAVVKREMKQLSSDLVHVGKGAYISWKGYDCMLKANGNLGKELLSLEEKYDSAAHTNSELKEELLLLKENYESLAEKNAKLEQQMVDISSCFPILKDDLPLSETEGVEQHVLMLEPADHCVKEPSKADIDMQEARVGNVPGDDAVGASKATAGEGSISEKGKSRKCSMRSCKTQGSFQLPTTSDGTATGECLAIDGLPTATSTSATTSAFTRRVPLLHTLGSPLQQPSTTTGRDGDLQTVQLCSGNTDSHKDLSSSSSSALCLLEAGKRGLVLGGSNVGSALVLATPSY